MQILCDGDSDIAGPGLAGMLAAFDYQFAGRGSFRNSSDHERVGTDNDWGGHVSNENPWPVGLREIFA